MNITIINPPLISQKNDPHTGIVFMPFMLAYLSAYLKSKDLQVQVIDCFGEKPFHFNRLGSQQVQGLTPEETTHKINENTDIIFISMV